jgi:hypothetical protein
VDEEDEDEDGISEEDSNDELDDGFDGAEVIERLKDDLFAEEEDNPPTGILFSFYSASEIDIMN